METANVDHGSSAGGIYAISVFDLMMEHSVIEHNYLRYRTLKTNTKNAAGMAISHPTSAGEEFIHNYNFKDVDFIGNHAFSDTLYESLLPNEGYPNIGNQFNFIAGALGYSYTQGTSSTGGYARYHVNIEGGEFINNSVTSLDTNQNYTIAAGALVPSSSTKTNIYNSLFANNTLDGESIGAGAIYAHQYGNSINQLFLKNTTITNNTCLNIHTAHTAWRAGGIAMNGLASAEFNNCILWNSEFRTLTDTIVSNMGGSNVFFSHVMHGDSAYISPPNFLIVADPLFVSDGTPGSLIHGGFPWRSSSTNHFSCHQLWKQRDYSCWP